MARVNSRIKTRLRIRVREKARVIAMVKSWVSVLEWERVRVKDKNNDMARLSMKVLFLNYNMNT